ncbi:MAG: ABC transporter substrate binding protein [Thermodesulfobacteriota bacterium]
MVFASVGHSLAADITAIKSLDIKPYRSAITGFKSTVSAKVTEYVIRHKNSKGETEEELIFLIRDGESELIFTLGTDALDLIQKEFHDIPVVFTFVLNPNGVMGRDWDSSRSNFHGISMNVPPDKQLDVLKKVMPGVKRVGVVYDPSKTKELIDTALKAAEELGLHLVANKVSTGTEAIDAVNLMAGRVDALWMVPDTTVTTPASIDYMLRFSKKRSIPIIGISEKYVKNGALFALSFDSEDVGRQAGEIAEVLLSGKKLGGATRLYSPRTLKLSINIATAKNMGIRIPKKLVRTADRVY